MNNITANRQSDRRHGLRLCLGLIFVLAVTPAIKGVAPIEPLPVPDYSFDLTSWTVQAGIIDARDVLVLDFPYPAALVPGAALGLASPYDDLDALSAANAFVTAQDTFGLLFSVDGESVGLAPPDPLLIAMNVPYNVADQAVRGHACGDQFMSTHLFTQLGGLGGPMSNNVLCRNNYDEGGTDFSGQPPTSAHTTVPTWAPRDVLSATGRLVRAGEVVVNVYFSVTADSPSLETLPIYGYPSGAAIFFNASPLTFTPSTLYATFVDLQLVPADDIDALVVFDGNQNRYFDGSDQVLFSLAPDSPSLGTIPGASPDAAAADVFVVAPGQAPAVFASAADLGLGHPQDNIDALGFFCCDDALLCAARHGIRSPRGDLNCDSAINAFDVDPFVLALTDPAAYELAYPGCDINNADCNGDGVIDAFDVEPFVELLIGG